MIEWLSLVQPKYLVDKRLDVHDTECCDLENYVEEALGTSRKLNIEERHQDDELLSVDHAP